MRKILSSLTITYKSQRVNVEVWEATRGGTKSPVSQYYRFQNRWITPFEQDLYVQLTFGDLFKLVYHAPIQDLISESNTFINLISKETNVGIPFPPIPMKVD